MALALGKTLAEIGEIDADEVATWRRFYDRHPFGPVRGDLQAWLVARNCGELWNGNLRAADRSVLGVTKHPRAKQKSGDNSGKLAALAKAMGCGFTEAKGATVSK